MSELVKATADNIRHRIFTVRGLQVMVDRDLAELYGVENKRLNEQVKRNIKRFPEKFRFQLTKEEKNELVANCDRFKSLKHSTVLPHVFTEQGVSMLSAVLRSETAIKVSIQIMDNQSIYHIGASLKDLGKKWFAFSKMDKMSLELIERLGNE